MNDDTHLGDKISMEVILMVIKTGGDIENVLSEL